MRLHAGEWGLVRISVGFSGLLFRCIDLPALLSYLESSRSVRARDRAQFAIDWLVDAWDNGGRAPYVFRFNLLHHAAAASASAS